MTGDFNGDGRADLAVAGADPSGRGVVEVLLGTGDGTFRAAAPISISTGPLSPSALVTGDFGGDGRADLAVAGADPSGRGAVEVLLGAGDGTFRAAPPISTGGLTPHALVTGDFNGDGRADLAVAGADPSGRGVVEVLLGTGDGTFRAAAPISISTGPLSPSALVTGDFGGDGRADLAVAGADPSGRGAVEVLLGAGAGTFRAAPPISTGGLTPHALVTGDFNGDGRADLAVAGFSSSSGRGAVEVLPGAGDGTFRAPSPISTGLFSPSALATSDFNGDGRSDLVSTTPLQVTLSFGNGEFAPPSELTGAIHDNPLVADPGDGSHDVFVVKQDGDILRRKGRPQAPGSYGPPITINPGDPSRDITLVPTRQGPLLASVDLRDDAIALYAYRGGQFVRVGSLATGAIPRRSSRATSMGMGTSTWSSATRGPGPRRSTSATAMGASSGRPTCPSAWASRTSPWPTSAGRGASISS